MKDIKIGIYRHFKGNLYEVIGTAKHTETLELFVVYKAISDNKLWIRPKKMFLENKIIDGKEVPRFKLIKNL